LLDEGEKNVSHNFVRLTLKKNKTEMKWKGLMGVIRDRACLGMKARAGYGKILLFSRTKANTGKRGGKGDML